MKKKKRNYSSEKRIFTEEKKIEELGKKELAELKKLEEDVTQHTRSHPLTKITYHDIVRGAIGALFGTVGHFAFFYGIEIAEKISFSRATFLYLLSLAVCFIFMYYSGFRKVRHMNILHFIPVRVAVVYFVALSVVFLTLFAFGFIGMQSSFSNIYKIGSTNSLLAVLGASTADILGKDS